MNAKTPKETAVEFVEKFRYINYYSEYDYDLKSENANKCKDSALILVNEIIPLMSARIDSVHATKFWDEVKTELTNL